MESVAESDSGATKMVGQPAQAAMHQRSHVTTYANTHVNAYPNARLKTEWMLKTGLPYLTTGFNSVSHGYCGENFAERDACNNNQVLSD
jgi:hypothetical protein